MREEASSLESVVSIARTEQLGKSIALIDSLSAELRAVEASLSARLEPASAPATFAGVLRNRCVVYEGGRPTSNRFTKTEDRKGLLAAALPRADLVILPVDCIDHDSRSTLKRLCEKHPIPCYPLAVPAL